MVGYRQGSLNSHSFIHPLIVSFVRDDNYGPLIPPYMWGGTSRTHPLLITETA